MQAKQTCVDCHFFVKESRSTGPATFVVTSADRELSRKGDYSWHKEYYAIACHLGVWDEGVSGYDSSRRHEIVAETERRNFCFFWPHRPGMLLPAAKVLQEREAATREASRDRKLTIIGLWIAAIALLAQLILNIIGADK